MWCDSISIRSYRFLISISAFILSQGFYYLEISWYIRPRLWRRQKRRRLVWRPTFCPPWSPHVQSTRRPVWKKNNNYSNSLFRSLHFAFSTGKNSIHSTIKFQLVCMKQIFRKWWVMQSCLIELFTKNVFDCHSNSKLSCFLKRN